MEHNACDSGDGICYAVDQVETMISKHDSPVEGPVPWSPPATVDDLRMYDTPEKAKPRSHVDCSGIRGRRLFQNGKEDNPTVPCSPGRKRRRSVESVCEIPDIFMMT